MRDSASLHWWHRAGASRRRDVDGRGLQLAIGLLALLGGSCSAIVDPELPVQPAACEMGDINPCLCANGMDGVQRCLFDGSFGECRTTAGAVCAAPASDASDDSGPRRGNR